MRGALVFVILFATTILHSQSLADLNSQREKAMSDIEYVDKMLKSTASERNEGIQSLNIVNSKLRLRENILSNIREELQLISDRIDLSELSISLMENDLIRLINDYEKAVLHAQKVGKGQPDFVYIFSSKDLNQGYKRLRYLQQVAKYRRVEAELIMDLKDQIEKTKIDQEQYLEEIVILRQKEEAQRQNLKNEQNNQRKMINNLSRKEKQLRQDLTKKKRIALEIEKEIERVIEAERKKRDASELSPEEKLVGDDFAKNIGLLPWPVERGVITSRFGIHDHPVFKLTKVDNIGIEITSNTEQKARAVFTGTVVSVFGISGGNMAIIVRHGEYLTVYQNIINVVVKPGENVYTKQTLGDVFLDRKDGGKSIIKFMLYKEKDKKDPEKWLAKKR